MLQFCAQVAQFVKSLKARQSANQILRILSVVFKVHLGHHVNVASDAVSLEEMQLSALLIAAWTMVDVLRIQSAGSRSVIHHPVQYPAVVLSRILAISAICMLMIVRTCSCMHGVIIICMLYIDIKSSRTTVNCPFNHLNSYISISIFWHSVDLLRLATPKLMGI